MYRPSPQEQLRTLRRYRNTPKKDLTIGAEVERLRKAVVKQAGALGGLDEAWPELIPADLLNLCRLVKLTASGVLVVECDDSAACYELDRWKRSGGLAALRARCAATLKEVRIGIKKTKRP